MKNEKSPDDRNGQGGLVWKIYGVNSAGGVAGAGGGVGHDAPAAARTRCLYGPRRVSLRVLAGGRALAKAKEKAPGSSEVLAIAPAIALAGGCPEALGGWCELSWLKAGVVQKVFWLTM